MFEKVIESLFSLKIIASPFIVGLVLGFLCKIYLANELGNILFAVLSLAGLVVGIIWSSKVKKNHGASQFYSKVNASPDIDEALNKKDH